MTPTEYQADGYAKYDRLASTVAEILAAAIKAQGGLRLQQLQRRAKSPTSLMKKLLKNGVQNTTDVAGAVKDLAGCRAIFYTNTDVNDFELSGILRDNFEIDWDRTKRHHPGTDGSDSLFISSNYVVRLKADRSGLPEYAEVAGLWCEVQVQTTLNHAWSEMEHDIIYKPPRLEGFGGEQMKAIEARMRSVMREHLIPAGYEFQKISYDFGRLSKGLELFDSSPLQSLTEANTTNELFDVVERFVDYVLPNYDDIEGIYENIWPALIAAARRGRSLPVVEIETAWGNLPGKTAEQIEIKIAEAIKNLRYIDIERTFQDCTQLYEEAQDDDTRKPWLDVINRLSKNNLQVWRRYGAYAQHKLVSLLAKRKADGLPPSRPLVLMVLTNALETSVEGNTSTYNTITIQQGTVVAGDLLRESRTLALDYLTDLFASSEDESQRIEVLSALEGATRLPHSVRYTNELLEVVLDDAVRVTRFVEAVINDLPLGIRADLEHDALQVHYRFRTRPEHFPNELTPKADAVLAAALSLRDTVNHDPDFVIYKTLVGFNSVFADAWTHDPFDPDRDREYRSARFSEYIDDFTVDTTEAWLARLQRYSEKDSNDLATYMEFGRFVQTLSKQKPDVVLSFLPTLDGPLARFAPGFLHGLSESEEAHQIQPLLTGWLQRRAFVNEALHYLRHAQQADGELLLTAVTIALENNNFPALLSAASAGVVHASTLEGDRMIHGVVTPAVERLTAEGAFRWIDDFAFLNHQGKLIPVLNEAARQELSDCLSEVPQLNYQGEDLLLVLTEGAVQPILRFFDARLSRGEGKERADFDPIPFSFHRLPSKVKLAGAEDEVIEQAFAWYTSDPLLFPYRGGRLVTNLFRDPTAGLGEAILRFTTSGHQGVLDFALRLLRSYNGEDFLLPVARGIIAAHDLSSEQQNELDVALTATGVVSGEFGLVEAYRHKREVVEAWLADPSERVRTFAEQYRRSLDRMIASEQRRSEEQLELRKREYGEDDADEAGE